MASSKKRLRFACVSYSHELGATLAVRAQRRWRPRIPRRCLPILKTAFCGAVLAEGLLLANPSLALDAEYRSDSGIPADVITQIDLGNLRKSLADAHRL